ncbi:MAG TPA: DUF4340 domain-containing protein [Chthoniobacterales bacterium]
MKLRSTIILLIVAAVLAGFIFFFEKKQPTSRELAEREKTLVKFDETKINGIDIANGDTTIQLRREGDGWRLTNPVNDRADGGIVSQLLSSAAGIAKSGVVEDLRKDGNIKDALKSYGVQQAKVRLKLTGDGAPDEIQFGKDTAFDRKIYARVGKEESVSVIDNDVRNLIARGVDDFRDRKLTPFESSNVTGLKIKTKSGDIDLVQTDGQWNLSSPIKARADGGKTLDLISKANNARIEEFVTQDEGNLARFGLAEPAGTLILQSKDAEDDVEIQIGTATEKDRDKLYARVAGRASIYIVNKSIADVLNAKPNDLRDRKLARVNPDLVDRLTIEKSGQPKVVLARDEDNWKILEPGSGVANKGEVNRLTDVLTNTEITGFIADTSSDLPKYGLNQPVLTVRFSSYSSEASAEAPKGETPIASVQFGKTEGDKLYARVAEEPFVVSVQPGILGNLPSAPAAFKSLEVLNIDPAMVTEIVFQSPGGKPLVVKRDAEKWTASDAALPPNIDGVVATLAKLRAVKWLLPSAENSGLDHAQTIQFKTGDVTRKLLLGNPDAEGNAYAKLEGSDDIFLVNAAATQSLTPGQQPSAAPAPVSSPSGLPPQRP